MILDMDFAEGMGILIDGYNVVQEGKLFLRWSISYQTQMTFESFKEKLKYRKVSRKAQTEQTAEEILADVERMLDGRDWNGSI